MNFPAAVEVLPGDTRERLLCAASDAFFADGYRVSMEDIAARAGVAKQTLYNHFKSKDVLFGEVVRVGTQRILLALDGEPGDLRTALLRFAHAYRATALSAKGIAMYRAMMAEAARFPVLASAVYAVGPAQTIRQLAGLLDKAMQAGQLRKDTPEFAAEMLMAMLTGLERTRALFGIDQTTADEAKIERVVDCFLRAYARPPENFQEKS